MLTQGNPNKRKEVTPAISRSLMRFFFTESKDEEWERLNQELERHIKTIYSNIHSTGLKRVEEYGLLRDAFEKNEGTDLMDPLREKILELHKQHRETISGCERCGECCCATLGCVIAFLAVTTLALSAKAPMPANMMPLPFPNMDHEDPSDHKSPYKNLSTAVKEYAAWYSKLPKYLVNGSTVNRNLKTACKNFKKAHIAQCEEAVIPVAKKLKAD